jgi:hypothetical protein
LRNQGALDRKVLLFLGGLKGYVRYVDNFNFMGFGHCGSFGQEDFFFAPVTAKKKTEVFYSESSVSFYIFRIPPF